MGLLLAAIRVEALWIFKSSFAARPKKWKRGSKMPSVCPDKMGDKQVSRFGKAEIGIGAADKIQNCLLDLPVILELGTQQCRCR
ncbi:unnamed protein product [Strongylus vulgaris]|uniref:Uncharacterized protein n=1 Tax=Strongylus vulgaris TaxID=40348 RepID=A0A3P7ITJ6_STRVU|nr:unnamed protein product [Strongylus vulgaris]